ncbi:hypothetical protein NDI85_19865 [Halomicroarcula sp. S1AR25-4]|uniref:hypothetical protein n=1 Tax=Haloarcula sp. S1AR25-4 TaxID=2950538 RepID=UPI0028764475|nr:hypothetical protein [Halomicroarcula sp. S1AR25-4]MDS0280045.1 hypothetical protein [Halomicroarcula sp. S1AR25-4]
MVSEHDDLNSVNRSDTKYGDRVGDALDRPAPEPEQPDRTSVTDHDIEVIYETDPGRDDGYGREKYSATIRYDDETGEPYVLFVVEHRWKGNYWRDVTDWDWRDVPEPVRQRIAAALPVDGPAALATDQRLIDAGGESRWEKHHKHRVEDMSGDEMWGTSFLRDAMDSAESAAEAFDDDSSGERIAEKVVGALQKGIRGLEPTDDTTEGSP